MNVLPNPIHFITITKVENELLDPSLLNKASNPTLSSPSLGYGALCELRHTPDGSFGGTPAGRTLQLPHTETVVWGSEHAFTFVATDQHDWIDLNGSTAWSSLPLWDGSQFLQFDVFNSYSVPNPFPPGTNWGPAAKAWKYYLGLSFTKGAGHVQEYTILIPQIDVTALKSLARQKADARHKILAAPPGNALVRATIILS